MRLEENRSLKQHNSFGFEVNARYFTEVTSEAQLLTSLRWARQKSVPVFILGGGSNIVFTRDVEALVIHIAIMHYSALSMSDQRVQIRAGAGMIWHALVAKTLSDGYYGLENLALIPGYAGAAPIQNIGAYGSEVKNVLVNVETIDSNSGETRTLSNEECQFCYRHSVFKTHAGANLVVTAITLELSLEDHPRIEYQALKDAVTAAGIANPSATDVFDLVCQIRRSKLPDPSELGNAGSFFKNPVITRQQLDAIATQFSDVPAFSQADGRYKVPAAWLIERAGWKGYRDTGVGVHDRQALVLINHGHGSGQQIAQLADEIKSDIQNRFNVCLEREPVLY
jgi:UDP-N-acetylmuramate dehydrogenase